MLKSVWKWDNLFYLMLFLTPLSVNVFFSGGALGLSFPLEPLLAFMCLLFAGKVLYDRGYHKKILFHPATILIMAYLAWLIITSMTSQLPMVSLKQTITKIWYIIPAYFIGAVIFRKDKHMRIALWSFLSALVFVVLYASINLLFIKGYSFSAAFGAMYPFIKEHTNYGALIALFLPLSIYLAVYPEASKRERICAVLCSLILAIGLVLSVSRAAWVSAFAGMIFFLLIYLKVKFRWIAGALALLCLLFFVFRQPVMHHIRSNDADRTDHFMDQIKSIYNITSSASNLERINRWKCGWQMFKESPVYGKGPGTYQFLYGPYQNYNDRSEGSTNQGNLGKVDNEYMVPLIDSGLVGFILFMGLVILIFAMAFDVIRKSKNKSHRQLAMAICISFVTFFTHGFFNSFLELDKTAIPFFFLIAMLVNLTNRTCANSIA